MYSIFSTDELVLTWGKYLPADWVADEDAVDVSRAFDADETVGAFWNLVSLYTRLFLIVYPSSNPGKLLSYWKVEKLQDCSS